MALCLVSGSMIVFRKVSYEIVHSIYSYTILISSGWSREKVNTCRDELARCLMCLSGDAMSTDDPIVGLDHFLNLVSVGIERNH